ncbi:hypothetical protein GHK68_34490 [Sinorhizobium meliloti]|uniref:Uncharacterized protein n=1 Tax=Rhizobium meliloti TaxID=382 RepID=I2E226_RHIML|nr:hypothetical protein [Sinorhizobium meliloti]AFJ91544.1 short hypothetical protein [Sinorhizobium meliloti]MQW47189.1 hypothetical protein [Sinorhizobium meliloti]
MTQLSLFLRPFPIDEYRSRLAALRNAMAELPGEIKQINAKPVPRTGLLGLRQTKAG